MGRIRERLRLYRPARKMAKRMQKTGDFSEFEELVQNESDEEIERLIRRMDKVFDRHPSAGGNLLLVTEYGILVEERKRRETLHG